MALGDGEFVKIVVYYTSTGHIQIVKGTKDSVYPIVDALLANILTVPVKTRFLDGTDFEEACTNNPDLPTTSDDFDLMFGDLQVYPPGP